MEIKDVVKQRYESETYEYMKYGEDYYRQRNTAIMERNKLVYLENIGKTSNPFGANHRLPSGHLKKIIDQKVMYLLGNGIYWADAEQTDIVNSYFEDGFDEFLSDAGIEASRKSEAWAYAYKDNGALRFTLIPSQQLTPIYDEYGKLETMIREYDNVRLVYTKENTTRYERKDNKWDKISEYGHYTTYRAFNGKQVGEPIENSFNEVPFIPLYNNKERVSDLYPIKHHIDTYDIISSDFANNIDDMQDAFFTLKGYAGDITNLTEFMTQLKKIKAVPIDADGDISVNQLQVPVEARETFLKRLEQDIYKGSMAVDLTGVSGGSITNVVIRAMFSDLDLKCDQFENEIRKFVSKIIRFINLHDSKNLEANFTLERSLVMNQQEFIETLVKTVGILSTETIRELLPYEIDLDEEKKRLADEMGEVRLDEPTEI